MHLTQLFQSPLSGVWACATSKAGKISHFMGFQSPLSGVWACAMENERPFPRRYRFQSPLSGVWACANKPSYGLTIKEVVSVPSERGMGVRLSLRRK